MIQFTRVRAEKHVYNVPPTIKCGKCGKLASRDSDVELFQTRRIRNDPNANEENYKCVYTCEEGHETNAIVELHE
jgi:hypothetical protein